MFDPETVAFVWAKLFFSRACIGVFLGHFVENMSIILVLEIN